MASSASLMMLVPDMDCVRKAAVTVGDSSMQCGSSSCHHGFSGCRPTSLSFSCLVFTSVVLASDLIITNNCISSKATLQTLQSSYYPETQALLLLFLHCYFIGSLNSLDLKKIDHHISIVHNLPYALTLLHSWFRFHSPSL